MDTLILQALESVRCPFLTAIFCLFTFLGDELLLTAVIAVVYYAINKKRGETLMMAALSSAGINGAIKDAVRRPRPFQKGVVEAVKVENLLASTTSIEGSYSFPSGHSMNAGGFYGAFASSLRKKAVYAVCAVILLLVMTSRLYLGVHYPGDILGGTLIGVTVGWAVYKLYSYIQKRQNHRMRRDWISTNYTKGGYLVSDVYLFLTFLYLTFAAIPVISFFVFKV